MLIDPTKLIKDLKVELLKIYQLNNGIESNEWELMFMLYIVSHVCNVGILFFSFRSSDSLELLAYDGFTLYDHYTVSDALYDGCLLTTSKDNSGRMWAS